MPARIFFTGGGEVNVDDDAPTVRRKLGDDKSGGQPFTEFNAYGVELSLFVAADKVTHIQEIPTSR